jgi:hypothetical protein
MDSNFSSLPPNEEAQFLVYEQRMESASRSGFTLGAIAGAIVLLIGLGISLGVEPKKTDYAKDMNMSNLTKKSPNK